MSTHPLRDAFIDEDIYEKILKTETDRETLKEEAEIDEAVDEGQLVAMVILVCLMLLYVVIGTRIETKGCGFGHETGAVIVVGILISWALS